MVTQFNLYISACNAVYYDFFVWHFVSCKNTTLTIVDVRYWTKQMSLNLQGFFKPSLIPNSKSKIPNPYIIDSYEFLFKDCCLNILNGKNNLLGRYITDRGMIYLVPLMTTTRGQPATCK